MVYHRLDPRHAVPLANYSIFAEKEKLDCSDPVLWQGGRPQHYPRLTLATERQSYGHTLTKTLQEITPQQAQTLPTGQLQPFTHIIHYYYHYSTTTIDITSMTSTTQQSAVLLYKISMTSHHRFWPIVQFLRNPYLFVAMHRYYINNHNLKAVWK